MRYIRTEAGVHEVLEKHKLPVGDDEYYITSHGGFYSYEVAKEADDIKDLCDAFVKRSREPGNDYFSIGKDMDAAFNTKYKNLCLAHYYCYAAIWVVDGSGLPVLKPVAKLNEKGELKLL